MSVIDPEKNKLIEGAPSTALSGLKRAIEEHKVSSAEKHPISDMKKALYENGICGFKGAFPREWAEQLRAEHLPIMEEDRSRERGHIPRGPNRFYHAVHPERLSGFVDVITHPMFDGMCQAVLGWDYQIVEVGFDIPLPGAKDQPWHRDFPMPSETQVANWLSSLVFNITTVDVTQDMGPFELAVGTHFDDGSEFVEGMFPTRKQVEERYSKLAKRFYPQMGDMSCRTGLGIHRGTEHNSPIARPVLIIGVVANVCAAGNKHKIRMTRKFFESLPETVQSHLNVELEDVMTPIEQAHDIEGLKKY